MEQNIASKVSQCLQDFGAIPKALEAEDMATPVAQDSKPARKLRDEFAKFKVWAGNMGAHRTGMASLDYRLRDASHVKGQVFRLLEDLHANLEEMVSLREEAAGPKTAAQERDVGEGMEPDSEVDIEAEIQDIHVDIADVIDCLLRLSMTIQHPAPHDRYLRYQTTDKSHHEHWDIQHVRSKFDKIDDEIAERLGRAISRRRQYFQYRESHHEKLAFGLDGNEDDAPHTVASSLPEHLKQEKEASARVVLEDDRSDTGYSETSYATTAVDTKQRRIPPMPKAAFDGPFECPFCHMIIKVDNRVAWKKHVYGDLRPYICIEKDCRTPEVEYARRHLWIQHVKQSHWRLFYCPLGCDTTVRSPEALHSHLADRHGVGNIDPRSIAPRGTDVQEYQRHIGRHQEQIALFALPDISSPENAGESDEEQESEAADSAESTGDRIDLANNNLPITLSVEYNSDVDSYTGSNDEWDKSDHLTQGTYTLNALYKELGLNEDSWGSEVPDTPRRNSDLTPEDIQNLIKLATEEPFRAPMNHGSQAEERLRVRFDSARAMKIDNLRRKLEEEEEELVEAERRARITFAAEMMAAEEARKRREADIAESRRRTDMLLEARKKAAEERNKMEERSEME
ncbi:hypothetical protein B0I35DRAFT_192058 [Stachybotrys elegans]|uniref:C2H2-type domain-containing protein n=1 Tax=Stachybotrys elegans TaxID=80388 RepID=A0A8K0T1H2_9HYPO|nr:hypothetical protein B0I35DRAFT_192058 [Stachybotrys elegans]